MSSCPRVLLFALLKYSHNSRAKLLKKKTHNRKQNKTVIEIINLAFWQKKDSGGINIISDLDGFPKVLSASLWNSGSQA